jgi:hypothetical protein
MAQQTAFFYRVLKETAENPKDMTLPQTKQQPPQELPQESPQESPQHKGQLQELNIIQESQMDTPTQTPKTETLATPPPTEEQTKYESDSDSLTASSVSLDAMIDSGDDETLFETYNHNQSFVSTTSKPSSLDNLKFYLARSKDTVISIGATALAAGVLWKASKFVIRKIRNRRKNTSSPRSHNVGLYHTFK